MPFSVVKLMSENVEEERDRRGSSIERGVLVAFLGGFAKLDFTTPFGFEDLGSGDAACGIRVED